MVMYLCISMNIPAVIIMFKIPSRKRGRERKILDELLLTFIHCNQITCILINNKFLV